MPDPDTPEGERIATFVQISDLHIGEPDSLGNAKYSALGTAVFSKVGGLFDGLLGHHRVALEELAQLFESLTAARENPRLIVTGDLSRCGGIDELTLARQYIESEIDIQPPVRNMIGLNLGHQKLIIPGNHDQWGGVPQPVSALAPQFNAIFPGYGNRVERLPISTDRQIVFICIDSDHDVHRASLARFLARGGFQGAFKQLPELAKPKPPEEIRVVLIHHSWDTSGLLLSMEIGSKGRLSRYLHENEVSAILTGHAHTPSLVPFTASIRGSGTNVQELRCGTTSQVDTVPTAWTTVLGNLPQRTWPANSLLVHRLYLEGQSVSWYTQIYARHKTNAPSPPAASYPMPTGFQPISGGGNTFVL